MEMLAIGGIDAKVVAAFSSGSQLLLPDPVAEEA